MEPLDAARLDSPAGGDGRRAPCPIARPRLPAERAGIPGVSDPEAPRLAVTALRLATAYDRLRLETYRDRGPRGSFITVASLGEALALRYEDVSYFNRVYAPADSVWDRLEELEAFYAGGPFGFELVGPPAGPGRPVDRACGRPGWVRGERYAWLAGLRPGLVPRGRSAGFELREPDVAERDIFLHTYLGAFEAGSDRRAAIENMRHLFDRPELHFLLAFEGRAPVGIGMLFRTGDVAVLCGGATLPGQRNRGCHSFLIAERIRLALEQGCQAVFSWARADGQSHENMRCAGLQTVGTTSAWRFLPELA
jgi:hypothetical protein